MNRSNPFRVILTSSITLWALPVLLYGQVPSSSQRVVDMLPGVVEPAQQVTVSAPFDGVLMHINVQEGDVVQQGQPIAYMDRRVAQAAVTIAQQVAHSDTEIQIAKSQLEAAQRFEQRVVKAHRHRAASDAELDKARADVEQASGLLQRAREERKLSASRLQLERARLAEHTIAAPFDGTVVRVFARPGESLNRSDDVALIANRKKLNVDMHVPITFFRRISIGQTCQLVGAAPVSDVIDSTLVVMEPHIDPATHTFRCRFEIENQDESLPAGFTARLVAPENSSHNVDTQSLTKRDRP